MDSITPSRRALTRQHHDLPKNFKRRIYNQTESFKRGYKSSIRYVDSLFERYARLLVLRIDFGFSTCDPDAQHPVGYDEVKEAFERFLNSKRSKSLYSNCVGYIWRLEYGLEKGYHYHCFFFYDGSKNLNDRFIALQIGKDWENTTKQKGIFHSCNEHKHKYKRLAIGMISHDDSTKRENILKVLMYMHKEDQILYEKHSRKARNWGRGEHPKPKPRRSGRPRKIQ